MRLKTTVALSLVLISYLSVPSAHAAWQTVLTLDKDVAIQNTERCQYRFRIKSSSQFFSTFYAPVTHALVQRFTSSPPGTRQFLYADLGYDEFSSMASAGLLQPSSHYSSATDFLFTLISDDFQTLHSRLALVITKNVGFAGNSDLSISHIVLNKAQQTVEYRNMGIDAAAVTLQRDCDFPRPN